MIRNITLPTKGRAFTNYSDERTAPARVAQAIWAAVNAFGEVEFTRHLDGSACSHQCLRAKAGTWITCSCSCGGTHHGGVSRDLGVIVDAEAGTSTIMVNRFNVHQVTGLPEWGIPFRAGDRVEYTGEYAPSSDDPYNSDMATVVSADRDFVRILWDYSGISDEVLSINLRGVELAPAA